MSYYITGSGSPLRMKCNGELRPVRVDGDIAYVPLANRKESAVIDAEFACAVSNYNWAYRSDSSGNCVRAYIDGKTVPLARFLVKPERGMVVDHVNGDALDNRLSNLRVCKQGQNARNKRRSGSKSSGHKYKGVYPVTASKSGRWQAIVDCNGDRYYLGTFATQEAAAVAYNRKAAELFGEYARLNEV